MKKSILIFASLTVFLFVSCNKERGTNSVLNNLTFGHFYSECDGEYCVEIFKLENDKLFEDTSGKYPSWDSFYEGSFEPLSQQKFDATQDLLDNVPADLLNETDIVIGMPDAGDGGGLYIACTVNGIQKFWLLDQWESNVPAQYHNFIDKVNEKIAQLQ